MPDTKDYQPWQRYRDAMTASAKLAQSHGDARTEFLYHGE